MTRQTQPMQTTPGHLSGAMVCRLMRRHKTTIKALADRHQVTQKRIREVREKGVKGFGAQEWVWIITGAWPGEASR